MEPMSAMSGQGNSVDLGATATNTGGTNSVGGNVFGNYNPAASSAASQAWVPWAVVGVVVLGGFFMMTKGK